jgi:hypothetical protein
VQRLDKVALGEARKLFATSRNVADRVKRSTGLDAEVMPHPPQELPYRTESYDDFVLSVGRLDRAKRHELLLDALAADSSLTCVIVGDGPDRERLEDVAQRHGLDGRARFAGRVDEQELADLYARCLAVYYAPVDEDFGMVPFEAFLSEKPVVTTTDAGGPLEVVADRRRGSSASRARPPSRRRAPGCARTSTTRRRGDAPARRLRAACRGTRRSRACSRESRVLLAAPARAVRHCRLLRAAAPGTRAADRGGRRPARAHSPGRR